MLVRNAIGSLVLSSEWWTLALLAAVSVVVELESTCLRANTRRKNIAVVLVTLSGRRWNVMAGLLVDWCDDTCGVGF